MQSIIRHRWATICLDPKNIFRVLAKQLSLGILDEMMTLATGALKRAVFGIMANEERKHHG